MKIYSNFIKLLLVLFILARFLLLVKNNWSFYQSPFNYQQADYLYLHSQFAPDPDMRSLIIQDWDLYPYAGINYLTGKDISTINIEHPPLGKYLYGFSYLLTKRPLLLQIPLYLGLLILAYLLAKKITNRSMPALLLPLALSFEPLLNQQLQLCLLELMQTVFLLAFILSVISQNGQKLSLKNSLISGILLGAYAGIKFPMAAILLALAYAVYLCMIYKAKSFSYLWPTILTALLFYLLLYSPILIQDGVGGLITVHLKAIHLHLSHVPEYPPFAPLRLMLFNQWPVWFDNQNPIHSVEQWQLSWPLLALATIGSMLWLIMLFIRHQKQAIILPLLFLVIYFIFINSRLFFPSYIIQIFPLMHLAVINGLLELKKRLL